MADLPQPVAGACLALTALINPPCRSLLGADTPMLEGVPGARCAGMAMGRSWCAEPSVATTPVVPCCAVLREQRLPCSQSRVKHSPVGSAVPLLPGRHGRAGAGGCRVLSVLEGRRLSSTVLVWGNLLPVSSVMRGHVLVVTAVRGVLPPSRAWHWPGCGSAGAARLPGLGEAPGHGELLVSRG